MDCRVSQPAAFNLLCIAGHLPLLSSPPSGIWRLKCPRPRELPSMRKKGKFPGISPGERAGRSWKWLMHYLAVIERPKSQVWYKRQRIGIHSVNSYGYYLWLLRPRSKIKGSQNAGEETQSCQPTSLRNYWRHWPYKRALFSRLRRRRWKWTTTDFLNHKLRRSGKHLQPTPASSKCWPFLCWGKHADDEWGAVDDNQQFPRLSSDHQLQAQPKGSRAEVQCSTGRTDCRGLLNFDW